MQKYPTPGTANLLFLISLVLVLAGGARMQDASPRWGLLATELLCILLPALLYLRLAGLPARETLRLRWPGARLALLSLMLGAAVWCAGTYLEAVSAGLFGYSMRVPAGIFPATPAQAAILVAGLAIAAPVAEELLFRGILQRAYEPYGTRTAILASGSLFALYHMRLSGLIALLPVALVLGYVAWRGDSLVAAMLLHGANNAMAAALVVYASMRPGAAAALPVGTLPLALAGAAAAAGGLWLFRRWTATPQPAERSGPANSVHWALRAAPLLAAVVIYLFAAAGELVAGRFPEALATERLALTTAPWTGPARWEYEVRTVLAEPVGQAQCLLTPTATTYNLDCRVQYAAFEAQSAGTIYVSAAVDAEHRATWDRANLRLLSAEGHARMGTATHRYVISPQDAGLAMTVTVDGAQAGTLALAPDALVDGEWPWRLQALPLDTAFRGQAVLAWPWHRRPAMQDSGPSAGATIVDVTGGEPLATPAGSFIAWRVRVADQVAWYDRQAPHVLLRYDAGDVSYWLTGRD